MKISICICSYRRPIVETLKYIPQAKVYVAPDEYESYKQLNKDAHIIACPEGVQGNVCRVKNYMLRQELPNNDVVLLVDDDLKSIGYHDGVIRKKLPASEVLSFVETNSLLVKEWGAYFWGVNTSDDRQSYRPYLPFSTNRFIGGPFHCFLAGNDCFYDERLPLKEDYDMCLQQLNKHRLAIRFNQYFVYCKQSEQAGGCATYRNREREHEQFERLQKKWGKKIIKRDRSSHNKREKKVRVFEDYNPIMKAPIAGV